MILKCNGGGTGSVLNLHKWFSTIWFNWLERAFFIHESQEKGLVPEGKSGAKYFSSWWCSVVCFELSVMRFTLVLLDLSPVLPVTHSRFAVMTCVCQSPECNHWCLHVSEQSLKGRGLGMPSQHALLDQCKNSLSLNQQLRRQDPFYGLSILQSVSGSSVFCPEVLFMRTSACSWRLTCHPKRRKYSWGLGTPRLVLLYKKS